MGKLHSNQDITNGLISQPIHWINTIFIVAQLFGVFVLVPLWIYHHGISLGIIIWTIIFYFMTGMSISAGYHRLFSHKSYEASWPVRLFLLVFGAGAFEGSCIKWSYDHRRHHRHTDTPDDPYSIKQGFWWAHMGWLFRRERPEYRVATLPDLEKDPLVKWQRDYYLPLAIFISFVFPALVSWFFNLGFWNGFWIAGVLRLFLLQQSTFLINSLSHVSGTRPHSEKESARDNWFTAFLTFGEGYHNFHHHYPSDYRNGLRWWQWDPTKWILATIEKVGLVSKLRRIYK